MFIDWLPEVLRPLRSSARRTKRAAKGWCAPNTVSSTVETLEPLVLLSAAPINDIARNDYVTNPGGYLSGASNSPATTVAQNYLLNHAADLGLTTADVTNLKITSQSVSSLSGATYIYYQQTYNNIPVQDAVASVTVTADGRLMSVSNRLIPNLASRINSATPVVTAATAVVLAGNAHGLASTSAPTGVTTPANPTNNGATVFSNPALSLDEIPVRQVYVATSVGDVRLAWNVVLRSPETPDWYDINIDGQNGQQINFNNWTHYSGSSGGGGSGAAVNAQNSFVDISTYGENTPNSSLGTGSYNVYQMPISTPDDGTRTIVTTPEDSFSSPFGWHDIDGVAGADFTDTRGNNVYAQDDRNGDDLAGARPDGTSQLVFDYLINLGLDPLSYLDAATTQLFYANNVLHDIHARYGFDAAAGNFQVNNYGQGGVGNDQVLADVQDEAGLPGNPFNRDNANFATPPDGFSGRMQMYVWDVTAVNRDGDLDNQIIIHEYGHGVSTRLTGGAANSNSLDALQSGAMGEGWGDFWALMLTQRDTDLPTEGYTLGTYVLGEPVDGPGIRNYPYSFDMTINPHTYADYNGNSEPHAAGEIWASVLWDLNWLLINQDGFDPDLYQGNAGNQKALSLVMEALKLQPANPSFLEGRDAILAADQLLYNSANQDLIWQAFARRGMGYSANDGGSADAQVVFEAFDVPPTSAGEISFDKEEYTIGDTVVVTLRDTDLSGAGSIAVQVTSSGGDTETVNLTEAANGVFIGSILSKSSETLGFAESNGILEVSRASTISVTYSDSDDGSGNSAVVSDIATFFILDDIVNFDFSNPDGTPSNEGFTTSGTVNLWHLSTGRGFDLGHSSDDSFYFGQAEGINGGGTYVANSNGTLTSPQIDLTNFTGPIVLSFNSFLDLEDFYDTATVSVVTSSGTTLIATNNGGSPNLPDATGGFQKFSFDLTEFAGQKIRLEFKMQSDTIIQREGWYVDDVTIGTPLATISGTKFGDVNGNGQQDNGELPLPGWTIYLDQNNNGILDDVVTTQTDTSTLAIPDNDQVSSTVTVSNVVGPVLDVNVTLSITHTRDSDLDVYLVSPAGTRVELFTDIGGSSQNFLNTTLDDQSNISINLGAAPFIGSFTPEGLLAALNGENPNGVWTLEVHDDTTGSTGTLDSWSITITTGEASAVTDANGRYTLTTPVGGTFNVREVPQEGWIQTSPAPTVNDQNPAQQVTVPFGGMVSDVNFYNQYILPIITFPNDRAIYTENEPPVAIDNGATVSDANTAIFANGTLTVTLINNASFYDRLSIGSQGFGTGQIGVTGNQVFYQNTLIGTFAGGSGADPLVVTFNSNATRIAVQSLLRVVEFETLGDNPSPLTRTVQMVLSDGIDGAGAPTVKQIVVIPVNDLPVVTVSDDILEYPENGDAQVVDTFATVTDPDSPDFNGGYLQISIIGNETGPVQTTQSTFTTNASPVPLDYNLNPANPTIQSPLIVSGASGTLTDVNVTVNIQHTNDRDLTAWLISPNGTRVKLFSNVGGATRVQNFTNTTFDDEASTPILSVFASAPFTGSFLPEKELFPLDGQNPNGTWKLEITDALGTLLGDGTGSLISWSLGLTMTETSVNEKLAILNQGPGSGAIGLVGNRVTYSGMIIGTYSGGVGTDPLVVALNAKATPDAVQALLTNVTIEVDGDSPILGMRHVEVVVNDGDGGTSLPVSRLVNVVSVNDAPVLTLPAGLSTYIESSLPTVLDTFATVTDIDSTNFSGGSLTVDLGQTGQATDRLGIRSSGQGTGLISVSGSTVRYGTTTIGTVSGGSNGVPLTVTFTSGATVSAVQALVRAITFQAVGTNLDTSVRIATFQVTDGDGGSSDLVQKTITVSAINHPPVVTLSGGDATYNANSLPIVVDSLVTITDPDISAFRSGRLTVSLISGSSGSDRLTITNQGLVTVFGTNVSYAGTVVGTVSIGVGSSPLTVNFNQNVSKEAVQAIARAVTFQIVGSTPTGDDRVVSFQVSDGSGGLSLAPTRVIKVQVANQPPVNTVPLVGVYGEEDVPLAVEGLSVSDPDASLLPMRVVLSVQHGTITIDTSVDGGLGIGDVMGNGSNSVVLLADQFTINTTLQALNGVIYQGVADYNGDDTLTMTTSDQGNSGPGGVLTDTDSVFINLEDVYDTATITPSASIAKNIKGKEALIDPQIKAKLGDNQTDMTGAVLIVDAISGKNRSDRFRLISEGKGDGQINTATNKKGIVSIRVGKLVIGTVSGGDGKPLKIVFNENATVADLQRVLRLITFRTAVQTTVFGMRTIAYNFTDALGLSSQATKQLEVVRP